MKSQYVVTFINAKGNGFCYGPFRSREIAEKFAKEECSTFDCTILELTRVKR
jgi:hypothetical protein